MTVPRAVVFDLGKVLLDFDYALATRRLAPHCRQPADELHRLLLETPLLHRYETGLMDSRTFYEAFRDSAGFTGGYEDFREPFGDIFSPIEPMIALHARLRAGGVPTFVFSNTNEIAISHIRRRFAFFADFDGYVFSYLEGAMKPDPTIYAAVERLTHLRGADLVYLDDRPENVQGGAVRGWQSMVHHDPQATRDALRRAGLPA